MARTKGGVVFHFIWQPAQLGVPSGTPLPAAALLKGMDLNEPDRWIMGAVLRFSALTNGKKTFLCEAPIGTYQTVQRVIAEGDIELLDMPLDDTTTFSP